MESLVYFASGTSLRFEIRDLKMAVDLLSGCFEGPSRDRHLVIIRCCGQDKPVISVLPKHHLFELGKKVVLIDRLLEQDHNGTHTQLG